MPVTSSDTCHECVAGIKESLSVFVCVYVQPLSKYLVLRQVTQGCHFDIAVEFELINEIAL